MKKFKLVTLLGIRPDIIRMHKLIRLLDENQEKYGYTHVFAHSGQHFDYELDGIFYKELNVRQPDVNFKVGKTLKESGGPTTHAYQTALLFEKTAEFIEKENPDVILFLGDTNTVLSSVVIARYGVPVVHIEGGGRSFDWRMPEEKCRIIIDHLSDMIYSYLPRYKEILKREGVPDFRSKVVGNIIVDATDEFLPIAEKSGIMEELGLRDKEFILVTLHREENLGDDVFVASVNVALARLSDELSCPVVFPIMPRAKGKFDESKIMATKPLGFFDFLNLEKNTKLIISDSGTVQEEALILGTPCLITRRSTERPETIEAGATILAHENIYENAMKALELPNTWDRTVLNPYGTSPSQVIFDDLMEKIESGFFKTSRNFENVANDPIVRQAYNK
jgi:UDP-N-acetylglucosamine 2-epimerase (non-hydrolysing)